MIKRWIFLKSTRKGQLKNVQDGISKPLCSREISNLISNPIRYFFFKHPVDFDICNSKNSVHYPFPAGERLQKKEK